jgi:hypothetical protein
MLKSSLRSGIQALQPGHNRYEDIGRFPTLGVAHTTTRATDSVNARGLPLKRVTQPENRSNMAKVIPKPAAF